jgi:ABC-type nitrate/sulfonate/bicarbonate transport system permease component
MPAIIDSTHHSTLLGISFVTVIQLISTAIIGGGIGVGVGRMIDTHSKTKDGIANFLRIGMWIPVFLLWLIPVVRDRAVWLNNILPQVMVIATLAVVLATLRDYIIGRSLLKTDRNNVFRPVLRSALIQALIVCLFSQQMMSGYGWHWYIGGSRAAASTVLVGVVLFIIEHVSRSNFDASSVICARIVSAELSQDPRGRIVRRGVVGLCLLSVWQLLAITPLYTIISSPIDVLASFLTLCKNGDIWGDLYISNMEMFAGVFMGVGIGIVFNSILQMLPALRGVFLASLPMTFITPLMALTIPSAWYFQDGLWPKILGIALISFFPFFRSFWGLRERPLGLRILMGVDQALPFVFVAMLFAESMASTKGLGFSLVQLSPAGQDRSQGLAIVLVITSLLAVYSWSVRSVAKHSYSGRIAGKTT